MTTPTYHLWLKPSGEAYEKLAAAIRDLSAKFNTPLFEPHVTLLSYLSGNQNDHLRRTAELARQFHPFAIALTAPGFGDQYFKCVYLQAQKDPPLMEARIRAQRVFDHDGDGVYMPHVSVLYGLYPENLKQDVAAALPLDLLITFEASAVYLLRSDSDDPRDWHEIAAVSMEERPDR